MDGMWPDGRVRDAGWLVCRPNEDAAPRGRRIHIRRREPQVADGRLGERYAQIHPGPVSDLGELHLNTGNGALPGNVDHRRLSITATGSLWLDLAAPYTGTCVGRQQQRWPSDPVSTSHDGRLCLIQRYHDIAVGVVFVTANVNKYVYRGRSRNASVRLAYAVVCIMINL